MKSLNKSSFRFGGIDFVDITFIILVFLAWVFVANAWKDTLSNTMLGISVLAFSLYFLSRFTGALKFLELTRPFWTISALISIPVWLISFALIPAPTNTFTPEAGVENALNYFIGQTSATVTLQGFLFPITESILAGILVAFFLGVGQKRAANQKKQRLNVVAVVLLVSIAMSLLHISIVEDYAQAGVFTPGIVFGHQLLSFAIMLIFALLTPFGLPGLIATHIAKNLLVYGNSPGVWIAGFVFFITMDVMSFVFAKGKEKKSYVNAQRRLIG